MGRRRLTSEERAKIFKALAEPKRIEIVDYLARHGALSGMDLAGLLGISVALLSHHWDVLANAGLIRKTRVGQLRYCSLDSERLHEAVGEWDEAVLARAARHDSGTANSPTRKAARSRKPT